MTDIKLSVIVCTYNRADLLKDTLDALIHQEVPAELLWEIIVVDNNSSDSTRAVVENFSSSSVSLTYIFEVRQGKSFALNTGIARAKGFYLAFTDDDIIPASTWVASALSVMCKWEADAIGGRILPKWETPVPLWFESSPGLRGFLGFMEFNQPYDLKAAKRGGPGVWGGNMIVRRDLFKDIGSFDTRYGPVAGKLYRNEDVQLIERALEIGRKVIYDPTPVVFHRVGPERAVKGYFRKLAFEWGEGDALTTPAADRQLFGVPLWRYRSTLKELVRWISHTMRQMPDSFERELDFLSQLGTLLGYWKIWCRK